MTPAQEVQDYLLGRSGHAKSFCARCLARILEISIGTAIDAMRVLLAEGRYVVRWGACDRCERPRVYVINTILRAKGEQIDAEPQKEPGESNATQG